MRAGFFACRSHLFSGLVTSPEDVVTLRFHYTPDTSEKHICANYVFEVTSLGLLPAFVERAHRGTQYIKILEAASSPREACVLCYTNFTVTGLGASLFEAVTHLSFQTPAIGWRNHEVKMESKLYVGNLSYSTTEDDLRTLFFQAGTVASVALIKDRDSGQSKGFAFVEMSNQSEAQKAISMFNGFNIGDREMRVSLARPREERGGFMDRGSGHPRRSPQRGGNKRY